jgi:hypothetical protein
MRPMSDAVRRQVMAILESNGLRCSQSDDGLAMRFSSAMLLLGFTSVGHQTVITLRAPVLRDLPLASASTALLARLNELNCASHFGKWAYYGAEQLVVLEYDLLGDHLQENELMTALTTLARLADQQDDVLQREFGGRRSFEAP